MAGFRNHLRTGDRSVREIQCCLPACDSGTGTYTLKDALDKHLESKNNIKRGLRGKKDGQTKRKIWRGQWHFFH